MMLLLNACVSISPRLGDTQVYWAHPNREFLVAKLENLGWKADDCKTVVPTNELMTKEVAGALSSNAQLTCYTKTTVTFAKNKATVETGASNLILIEKPNNPTKLRMVLWGHEREQAAKELRAAFL